MSLQFRISGRVIDQTGAGVAGLMVRAYDKDLLFDDLLGSAMTGADGAFELRYSEADFRELFERRPDVYLSLYDSPGRFLLHTKDAIRWNAGADETLEVRIDLEPGASKGNEAGASLALPKTALKIENRGGFVLPRIPGFATGGEPGAPAIPQQVRFVALPLGGDVLRVDVHPGEPVRIAASGTPLPAQEDFPDEGVDEETGEPLGTLPRMTPPDPRLYAKRYPEELVRLVRVEEVGPVQMAMLLVRPVQYDPATRTYLFHPDLQYTVTFDAEKARHTKRRARVGEYEAETLHAMLSSERVAVAEGLDWQMNPALEENPHLIITDNFRWPAEVANRDGMTRPPALADRGDPVGGDLVAELERLADWRTGQGMRSKVVTITDIVDRRWGDFTQNGFARDLQEVIRNFAKFAHAEWETRYLVLGGDVEIVPMRILTGSGRYSKFGVKSTADDPPEAAHVHVNAGGNVAKLHPDFQPAIEHPLSTYQGGRRIPYSREAGPNALGWYFTTEGDFETKQSGFARQPDASPTRFVIVEGPASVIDDEYYWVRGNNSIPSDFYYASLVGPNYSVPGKHDFDTSNNGLYGQSYGDETLDGVDFNSDVWVGRIPASTAVDARRYVDKLMTYEDLRVPGTVQEIDTSYLRKVLYAAALWGKNFDIDRQDDTAGPPAESTFTHEDGTTTTKLRHVIEITMVDGLPSHQLVAISGNEQNVIPYDTSASASNLGWFFTTSATYATQSDAPTAFIKVRGPEGDIAPESFLIDPVGLESGAKQKENLRALMGEWWPELGDVQRHYTDHFDLDPPPPIVPLDRATLRAAIDEGVHLLSLTGHGSRNGCCGVRADEPDFRNDRGYFIAFANSCSTAMPDDDTDSLGEISIVDEKGGAVAYVGNTRYSWIKTGDNYEEFFWCMLRAAGRAGPAAGLRLATDGVSSIWTMYAQTLYGDPALRVWTEVPDDFEVQHPPLIPERRLLPFEVLLGGRPVRDARVTVRGEGVFLSKKTSPDGQVVFALPEGVSPKSLQVTVTGREGKTYRGVIG